MYIKKWLLGLGFLLLAAAGIALAENNSEITLTFSGERISSEIQVIERDGARYINLPFLKYLHVINDWNPTNGDLDLRFGKYSILMYENSCDYQVNGEPRRLTHAPFQRDNQLWLPVEFLLRLGLVITNQDRSHLGLDWSHNYLLGIESVKYQERPAFLLIGTKPFKTKSFLLRRPNRLVVDIIGVKAHFTLNCDPVTDAIVKKVRFNQLNPGTVRLVFDLNQQMGYRIVSVPDRPSQVLVVFNYEVSAIDFFKRDNERKVYIKTSYPAVYTVKTFNDPNRLIIDFDGATLTGGSAPIPGDGKWVRKVRMSQFSGGVVRVVLDLLGDQPCFVLHSRENPNLIEIRTVQTVNKLSWSEGDQQEKLTIEADGELVPEITKLVKPERIEVDLDYSQFAPGLELPELKSSQVNGVRLTTLSRTEIRVAVDLAYFVGYDSQLSPDRRRLTLSFQKSPLIGKTVVLDPGHGGVDSGACGRQGIREKEVNLEVAMRLKDLLETAGAAVVLTRTDDSFIGLYERPFIANFLVADLFISIHTNNHPDLSVNGIEIWIHHDRNGAQMLAQDVLKNIVQTTGFRQLSVKYEDNFVVTREAQMPGILVELGFLSNFQEESIIQTPEFRQKAAQGIFQGIMDYYR